MKKPSHSETPATQFLKKAGVAFTEHFYEYVEKGGTAVSAVALGVPEHSVVKTLMMEDEARAPMIVLMHGDRKVSTRNLARQMGAKGVEPCAPEVANLHSGYFVGGTSPFATKKPMPVYVESSILDLPRIYLNGGRRGYLLSLAPAEITRLLPVTLVTVALVV